MDVPRTQLRRVRELSSRQSGCPHERRLPVGLFTSKVHLAGAVKGNLVQSSPGRCADLGGRLVPARGLLSPACQIRRLYGRLAGMARSELSDALGSLLVSAIIEEASAEGYHRL